MTGMSAIGGMPSGASRTFQPPSFSKLDSDSSGGITLEELQSNAPGGVSSAESDTRAEELFNALDADSDGTVTEEEKNSFDSQMQERMASMSFSAHIMSGQPPDAQNVVSALDSDEDGAISFEEFSASEAVEDLDSEAIEQLFAAIDADDNGSISEEETSNFLEENRPTGGPRGAGGPPPPPPSAEDDDEDDETETSQLIEMISSALEAYQSSATSKDSAISSLLDILDSAA